ncbi:tyrosine-protein kinase JAK2-like isoform X2 [Triticum dicoccoides]|uniref:tyrosine-protein kinase JAK2-like isoform X2 n=1 Tax=Triticum dicoccoides TaxID=85692 RepID=UPI00188F88F7|nr:tyrosine-protein kinase JAK2-like isoform X2 [Triticum dicoccoides]
MAEENSTGNKVDNIRGQPRRLSYQYLKDITNDFGKEVGRGAYGTVYKGTCENGEEIAVKVLRNMTGLDNKEFEKEFENLRRLKHQNVVELLGFCNESEKVVAEYNGKLVTAQEMHTALCFEFVCNGSLADYISDDPCLGLNWQILYKIIKGICQGLKYLRHGLEVPVWHLDLKPANILLDKDMIPKLADFGLSKLLGDENTRKSISPVGTCGYSPPEYVKEGLMTKEFDIFGLGVIIAKLMAGRKRYSKIDDMKEKMFIKRVHGSWRKKMRETLSPKQLEVYCEQVKICIQIAMECMKPDRQERPTIQSIISRLEQTEILIGNLELKTEQFFDAETVRPWGGLQVTHPEMAAGFSRGKTDGGKTGAASAQRNELPLQLLRNITDQFSEERRLRTGAFGTVYKGILEDGEVIAVKILAENSPVARDRTFNNEVQNLMALKNENVLPLVGCCYEGQKKVMIHNGRYIAADVYEGLLCYEYLPKGSLQRNLFEVPKKMDWQTRFKIIKGVCKGLLFLHSIPIIHMDLKPENIWLDNYVRPKIADFGLSRLFGQEQTRMNTKNVVGSYGYIAPEYLYRGEISTMSDIYSLGVLIMETSTGEKNIPKQNEPSAREFIKNVRDNWNFWRIASEYGSLGPDCLEQIKACIDIGLECVEIDRRKRPSIEKIMDTLNRLSQIDSNNVLCLQPQRINFPIGPKRLTSSSLYLVNNRDDRIAFRLETKFPRRYLTKLPLCGVVPPKCTYILTMIMHEQKKSPASRSDDCLILQSSIAHHEDLHSVDPASVAMFLDSIGDDEVKKEKVPVACESPAEAISNDQIIDGPNYREVLSVDVHPTEPWILTSNKRGHVCIWNYQTQAEVNCTEVTREPVYSAKFVEREGWFVVGSGDGCIYVYDYNTMEDVELIEEAHDSHRIVYLAVNSTHSFVLSTSDDHKIKLWDWTNEWQCTRTFEGHNDRVTQVMFNPRNSESFASASLDHTIKIWDIHSATCNTTWDGHPDGLLSVHYHPRYFQQFLISGSSGGAAKIWDLETDDCVHTLQGHEKGISALCWHPELRVLVTGSLDGTVRVWNWMSHSSTYRLENIIGLNLGVVNALGYLKGLTSIVVGCDQGMALMEVNVI